jgi:hypothetical protein
MPEHRPTTNNPHTNQPPNPPWSFKINPAPNNIIQSRKTIHKKAGTTQESVTAVVYHKGRK